MRNAYFEKNIYKIGLTTKETKLRAKQLPKTSVPDEFHVMREWATRDYIKAEIYIFDLLSSYRIGTRREFFKIEMEKINEVI